MKNMPGLGRVLLGFALLCASSQAWAEDLIVVEVRGAALNPGDRVDSAAPLVLAEGEHVTLISTSGVTLRIDGPNDGAPEAGQSQGVDLTTKLATLLTQRDTRLEVGTTRGAAAVALPEPWLFDVSHSGDVCLVEGAGAVLWRPETANDAAFQVMPADRSWNAELVWPAGLDRLDVGTDLPIRAAATYLMVLDGEEAALSVNSVPASLDNDLVRAAWMAEMGCEAQAQALLEMQ
jgi:hypothetical protein